jgi:dihydroorotate dehydrogenase electron transfer subunit
MNKPMAEVLANEAVGEGFWLLRARQPNGARAGQFYMLRAWERYPLLSRPVSVFDADSASVSFLYQAVGEGTRLLAALAPGDGISLQGPYGNGFPSVTGRVALVGGGAGIAPLHYAAKELQKQKTTANVDIYLGFRERAILTGLYERAARRVIVNIGGFVTDDISPEEYDAILTCGPEPMMRALYAKCEAAGAARRLYVSTERRMACGVGACLVCSCKTAGGNRRVCKDGPVFAAKEVYGI